MKLQNKFTLFVLLVCATLLQASSQSPATTPPTPPAPLPKTKGLKFNDLHKKIVQLSDLEALLPMPTPSATAKKKAQSALSKVSTATWSPSQQQWMWISILPAALTPIKQGLRPGTNHPSKMMYSDIPHTQFEQALTFYANPRGLWTYQNNAKPIQPNISNVSWVNGVTYVLLAFDVNGNYLTSLTSSTPVHVMHLFMFDAVSGDYLTDVRCDLSNATTPIATWSNFLALGFSKNAQSAGVNANSGIADSSVIGQYPVAFTIYGPQAITYQEVSTLNLSQIKQVIPGVLDVSVSTDLVGQPAFMALTLSKSKSSLTVDKANSFQFFSATSNPSGRVINLTKGSMAMNWATGVTFLLLAFDGSTQNYYYADILYGNNGQYIRGNSSQGWYLFAYDTKTGNLIGITPFTQLYTTIGNASSYGNWLGITFSSSTSSPANAGMGAYPTAFTVTSTPPAAS